MSENTNALVAAALRSLVSEALFRAQERGCWIVNPGEAGFIEQVAELSAEEASRPPAPGRKTVAAHANHIRFQLNLLNRWADGDPNPFASANWDESWAIESVTPEEWDDLLADLRRRGEAWLSAASREREWDEIALTGSFASAAHFAYHLAAVRQMIAWLKTSR